ncbi:phosphatidylserine/phosphatidylglycerophosphate/cardiolipin synthase family protein [Gordonia oryzae]|uniref:Phosphatidylserine/phosphatidylglycerophosphate/ cardiolipin synthase family protein n=1 Tax=Gordonia oryzae TaxID=2487349 RepID=A0A3N4GY51_9ACTN|nr:phospholipase D-like domain-containing protein [Gordonia oryzae]RPA65646.1 phosphatidylserine/phosphatidylglycerophosphate/cardiolipin synthase family protein [Gordonia oryzae]
MDNLGLGTNRTARLLTGSVWTQLTPLIAARQHSVTAAIAYLGADAHTYLPLRSGSSIIVDATVRAVEQKSTNPHSLLAWLKADVRVYSLPHLHAKMLLCEATDDSDAFVAVGSANVSQRSKSMLQEAVVLTDSPDTIDEARSCLVDWKQRATPLTIARVRELCDIFDQSTVNLPDDEQSPDEQSSDEQSSDEQSSDEQTNEAHQWPRPSKLFVTQVSATDDMSAEAEFERDLLIEKHDATTEENATVGKPYIAVFWNDRDRKTTGDVYAEGNHVVLVWKVRGRAKRRCSASEPGQVIHKWIDYDAAPERTYFYVLVPRSTAEVTYGDIADGLDAIGVTLDDDIGYLRRSVIDAVLAQWPDLEFVAG